MILPTLYRIRCPTTYVSSISSGKTRMLSLQKYYVKQAWRLHLRHLLEQRSTHQLRAACAVLCPDVLARVHLTILGVRSFDVACDLDSCTFIYSEIMFTCSWYAQISQLRLERQSRLAFEKAKNEEEGQKLRNVPQFGASRRCKPFLATRHNASLFINAATKTPSSYVLHL